MKITRRSRFWLLTGAIVTTLGVMLWSAYAFAVIWLRVRYARELAARAQSLYGVSVDPEPFILSVAGPGDFDLEFSGNRASGLDPVVQQLVELERPSVQRLLRQLVHRPIPDDGANDDYVLATAMVWLAASQRTLVADEFASSTKTADDSSSQLLEVVKSGSLTQLRYVAQRTQCFLVTGTRGESMFIVIRQIADESSALETDDVSTRREVLLIDTSGRLLNRVLAPGPVFAGRLSERFGKADQLAFGHLGISVENRTRIYGPGAVTVIEYGRLKTIRTLDAPMVDTTVDFNPQN